jgi:hypothetical protein
MADPHPSQRYGWREGDIEILDEGEGEPLLTPEDLDRILAANGRPEDLQRGSAGDARPRRRHFLHIHRRR